MARESDVPNLYIKIILFGILGIFILSLLFGSFYIVRAGERAVLLTFGNPSQEAIAEGLHIKMPFVQKAVIMDVKTLKYTADARAASKDLQDVKTTVAINYHLVPSLVPSIYQTIGITYADTVIQPAEQESIKAVTAQFTAEELITKREFVREHIIEVLKGKLDSRGIIVEEISIVNFEFSPSFTTSIEAKVVAEQNALAAKNKLAQVEYEAQQRVTQANGEAEAIKNLKYLYTGSKDAS